jgi:hypothetical protein
MQSEIAPAPRAPDRDLDAEAVLSLQAQMHDRLRDVAGLLGQVNGALAACLSELESLDARVERLERERVRGAA